MVNEHYFSGTPESALKLRTIQTEIAGRAVELTTANGVFSPEHVDAGTQVLLSSATAPPSSGNLLDLGCGWGPIALTLASLSPNATVWAVDVNERALDLVRRNATAMGLSNVNAVLPTDVPASVSFDTIWSNPPIRVGKEVLHGMMHEWMPRLMPGSDAWLVVQKNLGADSLHRWLEAEFGGAGFAFTRETTHKGFRVLRGVRA